MKILKGLIGLLLTCALYYLSNAQVLSGVNAGSLQQKVKDVIAEEIDSIGIPNTIAMGNECLVSPGLTWQYYVKNEFLPAWIDGEKISSSADTLVKILSASYLDGLDSGLYHLTVIRSCLKDSLPLWRKKGEYASIASLDIFLSDAFISCAATRYAGSIHFEDNNVEWRKHLAEVSCIDSLQKVKEHGGLRTVLDNFNCKHDAYTKLKRALKQYLDIRDAGGWPLLAEDVYMKPGSTGENVTLLYKRLLASGDVQAVNVATNISLFDSTIEKGVKKFQIRYGLKPDGIVDKDVINNLNITIDDLILQIRANMERWRWVRHTIKQPYIMVNIAGFGLDLTDSGKSVLSMKIIVGRPYTRTRLFSARMTNLVLNPWWEIPVKIARKEIVPLVKKDTSYLSKNNIKIYSDWSKDAREIPADSIKWDSIIPSRFVYRLRQAPGDKNALGRIKFMFPNNYDVYMHDTPDHDLFSRDIRTFSHGCIRIEKPLELAAYLLKSNPKWAMDSIKTAIDSNRQQIINLPRPLDVYICYWTSWVDENGNACFRPDIYEYDKRIIEYLPGSDHCVNPFR